MSGHAGDFNHYVRAIWGRLWLVAIIVILAMGAAYGQAGRAPAQYTAAATLLVTAPVITPRPAVAEGVEAPSFGQTPVVVAQDIVQLIASRPIATRVAKRLDITDPAVVQRSISAAPLRGTSMIRVSASARAAERAVDLANVAAEEFVAYFRETNRASMTETRRFVEERLSQARAKLENAERAIQTFKEVRQMPSLATATGQMLAAVAAGQGEVDAAMLARQEVEARLATARERLAREQPVVVASRSTSDNPVFSRYQGRLTELEIQRATLAQTYTPQHPRMEQLAREIAEVRSRLRAEARTAIAEEVTTSNPVHTRLVGEVLTLEVERAAVTARLEALQVAQRRRLAAASSIPAAETEFNRLTREQRLYESAYTALSTRYQEILLLENQAGFFPAGVHVIEAAALPARPTPSSFPRTAAAAGLAGLFLGIAAALFLEALDDRVRNAQDAERVTGAPVLAQIPALGLARPSPAPAVFAIILVLAVTMLVAAFARGYVSVSSVTGGARPAMAAVTGWMTGAQPAEHAIGIAGDGR